MLVRDIRLDSVPLPVTFTSNWNPSYSYATLPAGMTNVPPYWIALTTPVLPVERGYPEFRDITIADAVAVGAKRILSAEGLPAKPIRDVRWRNVRAEGKEAGSIVYARDWRMHDVRFRTRDGAGLRVSHSSEMQLPTVEKK